MASITLDIYTRIFRPCCSLFKKRKIFFSPSSVIQGDYNIFLIEIVYMPFPPALTPSSGLENVE